MVAEEMTLCNFFHDSLLKQFDTITVEEFWQLINFLREMDDDAKEGLLMLICVALIWYGLLRASEVFLIQICLIIMDRRTHRIRVHFTRATKTRVKPFKFYVPEVFFDDFLTYFDQLSADAQPETPLLKRVTKKYGNQSMNAGQRLHHHIIKVVKHLFPNKKGSITAHMWRRSAATQMADSGAGAFMLKTAGRWRSINVAEFYVAKSLS